MTGQILSHYRILEKLGEGGMGVVYKAEDLKLRRTVALKLLPPHAVENRERFLREAQAAASLNHPNICTVYEIDEEHGFIAMEFIEGQSVKEKIEARPLPLDEALDITLQACSGLQAAHEKDIVHRDIKPANLMLTGQGQVKVMDFGLAQMGDRTRITKTGVSMGTPSYMSPEQVRGEPADRRTDIWSLGAVLFETLCGRPPFRGDSDQAVSYGIVHSEPEPPTSLRSGLPTEIDRIIGKALAKDKADRYQNVADLVVDLRGLNRSKVAPVRKKTASRAVAAVGLLAIGLGIAWMVWRNASPFAPSDNARVRKFEVATGEDVRSPIISRDGQRVAYYAGPNLLVRHLDKLESQTLKEGEGGSRPFWSPDGEWLGFAVRNDIWKIPTRGGKRILVGRFPQVLLGAAWNPNGSIVVATLDLGLYEVSAAGGEPKPWFKPVQTEVDFHDPHWLPDGRTLLVATHDAGGTNWRILGIRDSMRTVLTVAPEGRLMSPSYASSGHLLFSAETNQPGTWALPFDAGNIRAQGEKFMLAPDGINPTISLDGVLCYWKDGSSTKTIVELDRDGQILRRSRESKWELGNLSVSPDGRQVAAQSREGDNWDIYVYDLAGDNWRRLTFSTEAEFAPRWSLDGKRIAYLSWRDLFEMPAEGGEPRKIVEVGLGVRRGASLHYGFGDLIFYQGRSTEQSMRGVLYVKPGEAPRRFLSSLHEETDPVLSPNGRLVAYVSRETHQPEVYLVEFPSGAAKRIVSLHGGSLPRWSPRGDELFFLQGNSLMATRVESKPPFQHSPPVKLFDAAPQRISLPAGYDVMPDGKRFVVVRDEARAPSSAVVVENWLAEFKK